MPIEFRCPTCNKLLRTKDETAGKQAKCPECGTVVQIPSTSETASAADPLAGLAAADFPPPMAPSGAENPYQAPLVDYARESASVAKTEVVPTRIEIGDMFSKTWAIYKREMGMVIGVVVVAYIISIAFNVITQGMLAVIVGNVQSREAAFAAGFLRGAINWLFGIWLSAGQTSFLLKTARGQDAKFGDLFTGGTWLLPIAGATILYLLAVLLGIILLIVPGIIVGLMLSQYFYLIIDRKMGVIDSLSTSREVTRGNKLTLFLIGLTWIPIMFVGILTCGIGLIFIGPYLALMAAVTYLSMTGQPTSDRRALPAVT